MMTEVKVRTGGASVYELTRAILLYESPSVIGRESDCYATVHQIERHRRGGARLCPGVPATTEACTSFVRSITDKASFSGWIAPEILYIGPRTVAWWRAPEPATVFFETQDEDAKKRLGTRSGRTPQPTLVHILDEGQWYVFAVKGAGRPNANSKLYRAPYFNVWRDGRICEGNVERPKRVTPETLTRFERAFFDSRFTHPNDARGLSRYAGGPYKLWRDLLDKKLRRFPEESLAPHGKHTLQTLLSAFAKGDK